MTTSVNSVGKSSDFVEDYVCSACESQSIFESADIFCETCMKFFCGKCVYYHDQLYKNHSKYGREATNNWPVTKKMEDLLLKCDVHKDEKLKMFCQDHSQLCCSDCLLLHHRQCIDVTLISESIKKLSLDMQQLSINLQTILYKLNTFKSTQESIIQFVEVSYNETLQEIRDTRARIDAYLDELEKASLKELDKIRTTLQTSLKKDVDNCSRLKDELQQLGEAVQGLCNKSTKEMEFIANRKCLDKIQECETYMKDSPVKIPSSMKFQANIDIDEYLSKLSGLGSIRVMNPNQLMTVKRKSEYNIQISSDTKTCFITGICSLPNGHVIVVDNVNRRVKLFDQQYNEVSHCDVSGELWDFCLITSSEVAVTVGNAVQFISVRNESLINGRRIQLQHAARGIAHHHGTLYVTSGTVLYHYTLTGTLMKQLYTDTVGGNSVWKCAVSPARDMIYVTNYAQHKLITLAMDGTLISSFTDPELLHPHGVHVTPAGHVLVCGNTSNSVIQVDHEGRKKLATLLSQKDGLSSPTSVCVNKNVDQITVGLCYNNKIIVLELQ
ncbi:uncharacterized protein LOC127858319 [Dreissena polymorpha]|nr:uncharacterized protein LOC127858319 [Dreissena polymorpha]